MDYSTRKTPICLLIIAADYELFYLQNQSGCLPTGRSDIPCALKYFNRFAFSGIFFFLIPLAPKKRPLKEIRLQSAASFGMIRSRG